MSPRAVCLVAGGVVAFLAVGLVASEVGLAAPRHPRRRRPPPPPTIRAVETPLGLQGAAGAGRNVVLPFSLASPSVESCDVEAHYGIDLNGDGVITDDEYRRMTEDRLDPRNTRDNRAPQHFRVGPDGAANAWVWRSDVDLSSSRLPTSLWQFTDQGRLIPDPENPGDFLVDDAQAGVKVRMRSRTTWRRRSKVGPWVTSEPFAVDNDLPPSARIDDAIVRDGSAAPRVDVTWTAFDRDSEDLNDNGNFDAGEDRNGNGVFDQVQIGAAFDWHRVADGEDPASMPPWVLERLTWSPCTRVADEGDTDSFRATSDRDGHRVYGTPGGRTWQFVWDAARDAGAGTFLLRVRPIDDRKSVGEVAYLRTPIVLPGDSSSR